MSQVSEKIITAGADGSFKTDLQIASGPNQIKISAFDQNGQKTETTLTIVYSEDLAN